MNSWKYLFDIAKQEKNAEREKRPKTNPNPHEGHRRRMRIRFLKDQDMETFAPHEALELLLYNAIPRKDTNELAHRLIHEFGSFNNVFDAPEEELRKVKGMTEAAIVQIKQVRPIAAMYGMLKNEARAMLNNTAAVTDYYQSYFINKSNETVFASLLDLNGRLITTINIGKGEATHTDIDVGKLSQMVRAKHAVKVILLHNHPAGNMFPSEADMITTASLIIELFLASVSLADHIIFGADGRYFSFYQNGMIDSLVNRCNKFLNIDIRQTYDHENRIIYDNNGINIGREKLSALEEKLSGGDFLKGEDMKDLVEICKHGTIGKTGKDY